MIPPYSGPLEFDVFGFPLLLFGTLVATGVVLGHSLVLRLAAERRVPVEEMRTAAAWALGAGFVGAHVADVAFYHQEKIARDVAQRADQQQLRPEAAEEASSQRQRSDDVCHHVAGDVYFSS